MNYGTQFERERRLRWGKGQTSFLACQHGKILIMDFRKHETCSLCDDKISQTHAVHARTHYNSVLCREFSSLRESEKYARRIGKEPIGDADFKTIVKERWPNHPLSK